MTVYRDQHGVWRFDFWLDQVRHSGPCLSEKGERVTTKTAAKHAELLERARAEQGRQAGRSIVRAGDYTLAQAQAALLKRVVDRQRTGEHIANLRLWGDDVLSFFGPDLSFSSLTQDMLDDYANHVAAQPVRKWVGSSRKPTAADYGNAALWRDTGRRRSQRQVNNYLMHLRRLLAIAAKVRDPVSRQPVLNQYPALEIQLDRVPRRKPRPISDAELARRQARLTPWARDAAELSRLFGLRKREAVTIEISHIDEQAKALFFRGETTKSGHDEHAFGGTAGWQLLQRLKRQAIARRQTRLISWPGPEHFQAFLRGEKVPVDSWRPVKSIDGAWRRSAKGIDGAHRFHDVRARYITSVAQANKGVARQAARHQHSATTDLYIQVADEEVAQAVAQAIAARPAAAARSSSRRRLKQVR